jgi:sugar-specific transcriptional regulator TrmB
LVEENLRKTLKDFGLTDFEIEVYLLISKCGASTGSDVAHSLRKDKAQVFRTLKNLQTKGFVETTLEVPTRFAPVTFEKVLESTIKAKKDEAARIENTKELLLNYWRNLNRKSPDLVLEKFMVIEGRHRIYTKIEQMVLETKNKLSTILTVPSLLRAEQIGLFDAAPIRSSKVEIQVRFLTHLSQNQVTPIKDFMKRNAKKKVNIVGRVPVLGLKPFPSLFVRDEEEALFFLKSQTEESTREQDDICLWTNSKEIVRAFSAVFEDYWNNATEITEKIKEIETGVISPETRIFKNPEEARNKYESTLNSARQEVMFLSPSGSLTELSKNSSLIKEWREKGLFVRILAPITRENLKQALLLSEFCEVRHTATSFLSTTIVDRQHLFQFKNRSPSKTVQTQTTFEDAFYTNDLEYVKKAGIMFNDLWRTAKAPSNITLDSILDHQKTSTAPIEDTSLREAKKIGDIEFAEEQLETEKSIVNRIINGKKYEVSDPSKDLTRTYGFSGQAVIHPPKELGLPDFMVHAWHNDKQSSYGVEDYIVVYVWLPTPKGDMYVPVAVVGDVPSGAAGLRAVWGGTLAGQNVRIVNNDELQVQLHGGTFFVGWTVPISLPPTQHVLPPAAILLEAFGRLKTKTFTATMPSRYKVKIEENSSEAFVTFYHPASKYSGPGTEGLVNRDMIMTTTPP